MSKIEIELPPVLAEFLRGQVEAGLYNSVEDAIEGAVRRASEDDGAKFEVVKSLIARGVAEADAGLFYEGDIEDIIAAARAKRGKAK